MSRIDQAIAAQRQALRSLAALLGRADLHPDDAPEEVVDLLLSAGFPEQTEADTALLDAIHPAGAERNEPGPGVCRGCSGNFSRALPNGLCPDCTQEASS
jgi:hypothetical protein